MERRSVLATGDGEGDGETLLLPLPPPPLLAIAPMLLDEIEMRGADSAPEVGEVDPSNKGAVAPH